MYTAAIAEDEALILAGITSSVNWERLGICAPECFSDGLSAWAHCEKRMPDLLITDLRMPGLSGQELIARVRRLSRRTRIIVVTCLQDFPSIHCIIDKDLTSYLLKATMAAGDVEEALKRAVTQLRALDGSTAGAEPAGARQVMDTYIRQGRATAQEFERAFPQVGSAVFWTADGASREGILARLNVLSAWDVSMDDEVCVALSREPIDASLLTGCLGGLAKDLSPAPRFAAHSLSVPIEGLPALYHRAELILRSRFFYPQAFYDFTGGARTTPSFEKEGVRRLAQHPLVQALVRAGNQAIAECLHILDVSYGLNEPLCRTALHRLSASLALHFPAAALPQTADAPEALRALLAALPEYEISPSYRATIQEICLYIQERFAFDSVRLSGLAERYSFSQGYLALLFRKNTGLSFTEYLSLLRMDAAARMLAQTDLPIRTVAERCGFSSESYFTRYFSQRAGHSPKAWRREMRSS